MTPKLPKNDPNARFKRPLTGRVLEGIGAVFAINAVFIVGRLVFALLNPPDFETNPSATLPFTPATVPQIVVNVVLAALFFGFAKLIYQGAAREQSGPVKNK